MAERTVSRGDRKAQETFSTPDYPGQLSIDFTPGLIEQFPTFADCVRASVYGCGKPFKAVASDLDMTVSDLSRKLANNPGDPAHFPLDRLPELLAATGDPRPVQWLVLRFLRDPEAHRKQALATIAQLAPVLQRAMAALAEE